LNQAHQDAERSVNTRDRVRPNCRTTSTTTASSAAAGAFERGHSLIERGNGIGSTALPRAIAHLPQFFAQPAHLFQRFRGAHHIVVQLPR
jgi:hypothetical protein